MEDKHIQDKQTQDKQVQSGQTVSGKKSRDKKIVVLAVIAMVVAVAGGFYLLSQKKQQAQIALQAQQDAAVEEQFNQLLKTFLVDVNNAVIAYKGERKVVIESIRPQNLLEPIYVAENYDMVRSILPSLYKRKDVIMNSFEVAEGRVQELVARQSDARKQDILSQWQQLKNDEKKTYEKFFEVEDQILSAYEDLITFYYSKRYEFKVDQERNEIVFKEAEDKDRARVMQERIDILYDSQDIALKD